jgi:uncharacterized membrane protein SpoIIM required for sporulation
VNVQALGNSSIIVVAVVYGILLRVALRAGILGWLLAFMVALSLWRYAYAVLRDTARGRRHLPPPGIETMNPVSEFSVVWHFVFFATLTYLLLTTPFLPSGAAGVALRTALLGAVAVAFPASAAVMGMTSNLGAAMNPASWREVARALGRDYAKLVLGCIVLFLVTNLVEAVFSASWVLGMFVEAVGCWGVLAMFLLIGTALRAKRSEFDLVESLDDQDVRDERARHAAWQKTLDLAYASIRSGLDAQAYRTIKELLESEHGSLEIYQWTFNGMLAWEAPQHAALLGERFAARLWEAGRQVDALELVQRCGLLSPEFTLPGERVAEFVAYARSIGRHRLADEVAQRAAR